MSWRALTLAGVPDDDILPAIEQVLISERNREEVFATLATVTVDLDRGEAAVRLAGHPPPLLLTNADVVAVPAIHGPVLGVFERAERPPTRPADRLSFRVGSRADSAWTLMLYTDGLIEGRDGIGDGRLDLTGLQSLLTTPAAARWITRPFRPGWWNGPRRPMAARSPTTWPCWCSARTGMSDEQH